MTDYYVKSGAAGTGDGSSWVNAYTNLVSAVNGKAAGDRFFVSHQHNEAAQAGNLTPPGTAASPTQILCVLDDALPPTTLATTAVVTKNSVVITMNLGTGLYVYGINFSTAGNWTCTANGSWWIRFENCSLKLTGANSAFNFNFGNAGSASRAQLLELINTYFSFGNSGQGLLIACPFRWKNTRSAFRGGGAFPTVLFKALASGVIATNRVDLEGVDLTSILNVLVDAGGNNFARYYFRDCWLYPSVTVETNRAAGQGGVQTRLINCSGSRANYRHYVSTYQGQTSHEITIVRSGGASDGTTPVSQKLVSTAEARLISPLESLPLLYWNETTGAPVTLTIPVLTDGVTLTNADAWLEVEYLGTAGFPQGNFASNRVADVLAAAAAHPTDSSSSWTTTGLASPIKQTLSVAVTPQLKGLLKARVMLARPSTTLYLDPKPVNTSNRQYWVGESGYSSQGVALTPNGGLTPPTITGIQSLTM